MEFDVRYHEYTFKQSYSPEPETSQERFKEHYHTAYELLYFLKGDADFMVQHTRYNIKPGSLLIAKPGEYHNIVFRSKAPYERYVIRFNPNSIRRTLQQQLEKTKSVYYISGTPLADCFQKMDEHIAGVHPEARPYACIGVMYIILSYLVTAQNLIQPADYINEDSRIVLEYIDRHLSEIHSVQDLSEALHMSRSSIYRVFSQQLDTTLMSYIRTQKCLQARLLIHTGHSPQLVASQLGFAHYSSFYRDYRQIFGEAPSKA